MDLSIIVPVYNVEKYVRPCLESILRQGLDKSRYEIIIVNDGSTDHSMEAIADLVEGHPHISVINQENLSLSVARNNGIARAKGEYILMPDSDDLLIEGSLPILLDKALETKADLVVADFLQMNDEEIAAAKDIPQTEAVFKEKTGEQLFLEDLNPHQCYVWRTLFRREFTNTHQITFVPGVCYQDVPFTHECYIKARKCLRTHWLLNIYRRGRAESASFSFNDKKAKDFCIVIAKTWELTHLENLSAQVQAKLRNDVYTSFSAFSYSALHGIKDASYRDELIQYLRKNAPDMAFVNSMKERIITFFFRRLPRFYFTFLRCNVKFQQITGKKQSLAEIR